MTHRISSSKNLILCFICIFLNVILNGSVCGAGAVQEAIRTCEWTGVETVVAVGDVHGDYQQFTAILKKAGIIDENNQWIAGKTHLVQTGDILDRAPDSKKVMDLLMALENQARNHGGAVHALIGNHEAMVMMNDWRYVHPGEIESHGGEEKYRNSMAPDGYYGSWIQRHNAVIRINDTVYVHGGISAAYSGMPLEIINETIREELSKPLKNWSDPVSKDSNGPLWYRGWAQMNDAELAKQIPPVLEKLGASRMVVGHTVSKDGIVKRCNGQLIMIDVGLSRAYGGTPACLKIKSGMAFVVQ